MEVRRHGRRRPARQHLRLPEQPSVGVWLLQAQTQAQRDRVATRPAASRWACSTPATRAAITRFAAQGVRFTREPVEDAVAVYAHFIDLYGNEFVLVQLK